MVQPFLHPGNVFLKTGALHWNLNLFVGVPQFIPGDFFVLIRRRPAQDAGEGAGRHVIAVVDGGNFAQNAFGKHIHFNQSRIPNSTIIILIVSFAESFFPETNFGIIISIGAYDLFIRTRISAGYLRTA